MNRRRGAALLVVLALVAAALVVRARGRTAEADPLVGLRTAAALRPCPTGVSPELPALTLPCLGGGPAVALRSGAPARPRLVNVWATWCGPCVREVPLLVEFDRKAAGRVDVVGVLIQDERRLGLEFARQLGMHYPSVFDEDGRVLRAFGSAPPLTLLVDAAGAVRHVERGEIETMTELETLAANKLGVRL